jgi:acyl-CoA reductase-like NAD-dependent aldehyde dehydrogenase
MTSIDTTVNRYALHIGGKQVPAAAGATFDGVNPASGERWATFADARRADTDRAVQAATSAFADPAWRDLSPTRCGRLLMRFADLIAAHAEELAVLETRSNGKLYREMVGQLRMVPEWLYYFGGLADKVEGRVVPLDRMSVLNYTVREPLGVVGIIVPWNSPVLLATMAMCPALAAGNTVVIKPSEFACAALLELAMLADAAGLPAGVVNVLTGGREPGEALVAHPQVAKIAFTGSTAAGRAVGAAVGGRLARCTLELGGKSANIVFADAELEAAEAGVLAGIFAAGGQSCIAGSRLLLERAVFDAFLERLVERTRTISLGDPMDPETQMGPVATPDQLEKVDRMVLAARAAGASALVGGRRATVPDLPKGLFYEPTILGNVGSEDQVCQEEVFGPVLAVLPFSGEDEAIELANGTRYGLAAGIWTRDVKRAHRVARRMQAGIVWVNTYRALSYSSPFGGYRDSGVGRTNGVEAISEYLQTKSVWCELGDEIQDPFVLRI